MMTVSAVPPRRSERAWLVVGSVATVVALLLTSCAAWAWLARLSPETETGHGTYRGAISVVVVDVDEGDLLLTAGAPGQVSFERRLEWTGPEPEVTETWDGTVFQITVDCAGGWFLPQLVCRASYTLRVPPDAAVEVGNRSGGIEVRELTGDVRLSGSNDPVTVADLTGALTVETGSGDVTGSGLRSDRVTVRTGSGNVALSFAVPPDQVSVETTTGNPMIEVPGGDRYQVSVGTTGNQEVAVVSDPDAPRSIHVRTTSGDVQLRYGP